MHLSLITRFYSPEGRTVYSLLAFNSPLLRGRQIQTWGSDRSPGSVSPQKQKAAAGRGGGGMDDRLRYFSQDGMESCHPCHVSPDLSSAVLQVNLLEVGLSW